MQQNKLLAKLQHATAEMSKGNYIKSISLCKSIIKKDPKGTVAYKLLITNLLKLNRFDEAEIVLKKVIRLADKEESYPLLHLLGCNYISQQAPLKALLVLEELFNKTGDCKVLLDIALSYYNLNEYGNARDVYLKLIELDPNNHQAKFNLYPILLHFKDYHNAWVCFHSRLQRQEIIDQVHWFTNSWNGEPLLNKNILIYPEQGIGDNLAYSGCFAEAIEDAKETYIVCDNRLKALYKHNFLDATVFSYADVNREQGINTSLDIQILAGSLSYLYRPDEVSFSKQVLLTIPHELVQAKKQKLSTKALKIGISWYHGKENDGNQHSMYLEELLPLLKIPGIEWVNLQFGEWQNEVDNLKTKHNISISHFDDCAASGDFEHYGALIKNLDLVISASNAALMFASRLGVKSWMFLPGVSQSEVPESFKDSLSQKESRTFYQGNNKNWNLVVQQFCDEVEKL